MGIKFLHFSKYGNGSTSENNIYMVPSGKIAKVRIFIVYAKNVYIGFYVNNIDVRQFSVNDINIGNPIIINNTIGGAPIPDEYFIIYLNEGDQLGYYTEIIDNASGSSPWKMHIEIIEDDIPSTN